MCKGAGMIGPHMATMLGVVTTDAALTPDDAQAALKAAVDDSFNCISVEGHMSTNDTVLLLASGAARRTAATHRRRPRRLSDRPERALHRAGQADSRRRRRGLAPDHASTSAAARSRDDARRIAQTIADSALVKTAIAGGDPNWGRIVSAAGYAGVPFDPAGVDLAVNGFLLYERGAPVPFDAKTVSTSIKANRETQHRPHAPRRPPPSASGPAT